MLITKANQLQTWLNKLHDLLLGEELQKVQKAEQTWHLFV